MHDIPDIPDIHPFVICNCKSIESIPRHNCVCKNRIDRIADSPDRENISKIYEDPETPNNQEQMIWGFCGTIYESDAWDV